MELVTSKEIAKVIGTDKFGFIGTFLGWILLRLLRISKVNKIYQKHKDKKDLLFLITKIYLTSARVNECKKLNYH